MDAALELLDFLAKATPIALTLGGILAFYFREKLKSILARSLAHDIEKLKHKLALELAEQSASTQRELEAYKVSLIAETEKIKAAQDIRKAVALHAADRRLNAIAALLDAHLGMDTSTAALATTAPAMNPIAIQSFLNQRQALLDRLKKYTAASDAAQLYISKELRAQVLTVRQSLIGVLNLRPDAASPAIARDHPEIQALLSNSSKFEDSLREMLKAFEQI